MFLITTCRRAIAAAVLFLAAGTSAAGPFTGGIVTLVVGGPAGSSFDSAARAIAEPLAREWGIPVIVDNRPGAAMMIAATLVSKAVPDGRTLLLGATPMVQAPHLIKQPAYDPVASFTPLVQLVDARLWLGINADLPARTVSEFVNLARKPGANFSFASPGNGSTPHLNMAVLMQHAKLELLHVPYKGIPPAVMDTANGQVNAVFASYSDLLPHVQTGRLRVLASTGAQRSALSKDVPTFREAGWAGLEGVGFGGVMAPAGIAASLATDIAKSIRKVMQRPEVKARMVVLGFEPVEDTDPQAFGRLVREQSAFWKKVIVDNGIKGD